MLNFALRNLILFFKDKTTVLLSFLAEFIIVGLYLLFMRDNLLASFGTLPNAEQLLDVWMIAGILGITSITTTMGAYGIMVEDKAKKTYLDFYTSPLSHGALFSGYLASAVCIGLIMSFGLLLLCEGYVQLRYDAILGAGHMLSVYAILALSTVTNSAMVLLLVSFLKSSNALAACCTILGALLGFLTGIYLPIGNLPQSVQTLVTCFPPSHGVVLLRQVLTEPFITESFGSTQTTAAQEFREFMGINYLCKGTVLSSHSSVCILLGAGAISALLAVCHVSRPDSN